MKVIDSHMHLGLAGYDADTIIRNMDKKGVEQSWLLTWEEMVPPLPGLYQELPPNPILEASANHPHRFIPFYAPDPARENLQEQFIRYKELGIKGFGELKVSQKWEEPALKEYLELVQKMGMALIFHMENPYVHYQQESDGYLEWIFERLMNNKFNGVSRYYLTRFAEQSGILSNRMKRNQVWFPGILFDFAALEQRIKQFPGIRFVAHGPGFWNHISSNFHPKYIHQKGAIEEFGMIDRLLEEYDNLYCDLSGTSGYNALYRDRDQSRIFTLKHANKLLYGTDNTEFPLMELLHSFKLDKGPMELILFRNAHKVLNG